MTQTEADKNREVLASILADVHFTAIEQKVMHVLADGDRHLIKEMVKLVDSQATNQNLSKHVCRIRAKVKHLGHNIVCEFDARRLHYRYIVHPSALARNSK